jgi:electron transfer flavoprotein beta subunit
MEILVCIKQVPDDSVSIKINPATNAPDVASVTPIVNAFDTYALEMATRLKEAVGDSTITVVTVGPDEAKDAIKTCLAVGASNGFVVKDVVTDTISTADALAKAVAKIEETNGVKFDLIFCGKETTDCASGQVGTMLAADLNVPVVPNLIDIEVIDGGISAKQETEEGYNVVEVATPCVVTVTKPEYEPRYPTIKSKMAARKIPIGELEVGGVVAPAVTVVANAEPPKKAAGVKINEETIEESIAVALGMMREAKVL